MRDRTMTCGLVLGALLSAATLAGCRSAPLVPGASRPEVTPLTRTTAPPTAADRGGFEWVRARASYDRVGLKGFVRTAEPASGGAPDAAGGGGDDLAKQSQNPIASLISVPFQNNTSFDIGPYDRTLNVLNIQPVIPIKIGTWSLINRTIIPIVTQPDLASATQSWTGLGDINYTAFFVPPAKGDVMVGAGPVILFPTGTDDNLSRGQWGIGPSAIVVATPGKFVIGCLANNIWASAIQVGATPTWKARWRTSTSSWCSTS